MIKGRWRDLEHAWVAAEGAYVYEARWQTCTLVVDPEVDQFIRWGRLIRAGRRRQGTRSEGSRIGPAVEHQVLAGHVAGAHAAQKGAEGAEIGGVAELPGGDALPPPAGRAAFPTESA